MTQLFILKKTIELDDHNAITNYGMMVLIGDGIVPDKKEAVRHFKNTDDKGNSDSKFHFSRRNQIFANVSKLDGFNSIQNQLLIAILLIYIIIHFN